MPKYKILLTKTARKQLDKLPDDITVSIIAQFEQLAINPRHPNNKKLTGRNAFRLRKGDYRIIYEIRDDILVVMIIGIGHRKDIYRLLQ